MLQLRPMMAVLHVCVDVKSSVDAIQLQHRAAGEGKDLAMANELEFQTSQSSTCFHANEE